jgi:hypothetical protein
LPTIDISEPMQEAAPGFVVALSCGCTALNMTSFLVELGSARKAGNQKLSRAVRYSTFTTGCLEDARDPPSCAASPSAIPT